MIILTPEISSKQFYWRNHPLTYSWTRQNGLLTRNDMERWHEKINSDPTIQMFGIGLAANPHELQHYEIVGTCGLTSISMIHGSAEFSLLIGPEYRGNAYGRQALCLLLKYGFNNLRLHSIWGECFQGNPAFKMFLALGFHDDGILRERYFKNGSYLDANAVSILKTEATAQNWWGDS